MVLGLTIETCNSNGEDWKCEIGKVCECTIEGDCTDGNLLVYNGSTSTLLCAPPIIKTSGKIDWDFCMSPGEWVTVIADCEEGQSEREIVMLLKPTATTSTSTTSITTSTSTTTTTIPEEAKEECPYECCVDEPGYEDKYCKSGYVCVDNKCVLEEEEGGKEGRSFVLPLILAFLILIIVSSVFLLKKKAPKTYEELYKKWRKKK
ncbi:MAG TPA: hypothetical protein ENG45_01035 [Candidatus Aenigmarchaeota archaeon]|nr:hypothetical protein [Candidatus Aenigmarchaeota archaeon]